MPHNEEILAEQPRVSAAKPDERTADEVAEEVLVAALGWVQTMAIYLGDRLGWYRSLAAEGPASPAELAHRTGTAERYAREWLEQQATSGMLQAELNDPPEPHRYALSPAAAEALTDERSTAYLAPLARMCASAAIQLPALVDAYRTGNGVSWEQLGADARESQADMNRPWFDLLPEVFSAQPSLREVLARPGARVADVGCGGGWASIALARAYPDLRVEGFDVDEASIALATGNAREAGLEDRVRFHQADGATLAAHGPFDAAFAFECIHDMPQPVGVLAAMREAVPAGPVVIMDEAVAERFDPPGDALEQMMYGFSLFVCLPDGLSHTPSVGTGTVMRLETLADYARAAGFADARIMPTGEFGFWRFYELTR
jgi:SAM-dependent methyltransferase